MPRVPLDYAVVYKGIVAVFEQLASRLAWRYQVSEFTSWCFLFFTAAHMLSSTASLT